MKTLNSYIKIKPFTVEIDDCPQIRELSEKARKFRLFEFHDKLRAIKKLTCDAMVNAYEEIVVWGRKANEFEETRKKHEKFKNIVFQEHPLSYALEQRAGCCRYQGALFFVLAYEADLGDKHFIQHAPVNEKINTVFNEIIYDAEIHKLSIFIESLKNPNDPEINYTLGKPDIFKNTCEYSPGLNFYSYHRKKNELVIVENPDKHVKDLGE